MYKTRSLYNMCPVLPHTNSKSLVCARLCVCACDGRKGSCNVGILICQVGLVKSSTGRDGDWGDLPWPVLDMKESKNKTKQTKKTNHWWLYSKSHPSDQLGFVPAELPTCGAAALLASWSPWGHLLWPCFHVSTSPEWFWLQNGWLVRRFFVERLQIRNISLLTLKLKDVSWQGLLQSVWFLQSLIIVVFLHYIRLSFLPKLQLIKRLFSLA